jgi:hypothetical protein
MPLGPSPALVGGLAVAAAVTVALGVWPQGLIELARNAGIFTG